MLNILRENFFDTAFDNSRYGKLTLCLVVEMIYLKLEEIVKIDLPFMERNYRCENMKK